MTDQPCRRNSAVVALPIPLLAPVTTAVFMARGDNYTSRFATLRAFSWMNSRRGSTTSPISFANRSSASSACSTFTCSSVRAFSSSVVSHSCDGIHFAQAFVALQRQTLPPPLQHGVQQLCGRADFARVVLALQCRWISDRSSAVQRPCDRVCAHPRWRSAPRQLRWFPSRPALRDGSAIRHPCVGSPFQPRSVSSDSQSNLCAM